MRIRLGSPWIALCLTALACAAPPGEEESTREIRAPIGEANAHPEVCAIDPIGCSGTLLAPNVVLSAGHCISQQTMWRVHCPYSSDPTTVLSHEASSPPSWPRNVNADTLDMNGGDDVSLIRLDQPLKETRFGKVNLGSFADGSAVYAIGRVDDGRYGARFWLSKQMVVSGQDTAHRYWVAVDFSVGQGGDSGGPLLLSGTQEIIGVDSLGRSCGAKNLCEIFGMVGGDPAWFRSVFEKYAGYPLGGSAGAADAGPDIGAADADAGGAADERVPDPRPLPIDAGATAPRPDAARPDVAQVAPATGRDAAQPTGPAAPGSIAPHARGGCACALGDPPGPAGGLWLLAALAAVVARLARVGRQKGHIRCEREIGSAR
jgi:MYXO-CTERM domain-containing protein